MTIITVPRAVLEQALEALEAMKAEFRALDLPYGSKAYAAGNQAAHGLRAALAQPEPRNQCGETCERAKLCAVCAKGLAQEEQEEQEPMAWRDPATDDIVSVARRAAWETDYGLGGKGRAATYTEPLYARPPRRETEQEPVAWTDRELELIDGMIEVQLRHASQCDGIANRPMAERQKGWDMERVALLHKIKSNPPRREPELLKALKLIRQSIVNPLSVQMSQQQLSEYVRAAIAKAEGQA